MSHLYSNGILFSVLVWVSIAAPNVTEFYLVLSNVLFRTGFLPTFWVGLLRLAPLQTGWPLVARSTGFSFGFLSLSLSFFLSFFLSFSVSFLLVDGRRLIGKDVGVHLAAGPRNEKGTRCSYRFSIEFHQL